MVILYRLNIFIIQQNEKYMRYKPVTMDKSYI